MTEKKYMDGKTYVIIATLLIVIFIIVFIASIMSTRNKIKQNRAAEEAHAAIFMAQINRIKEENSDEIAQNKIGGYVQSPIKKVEKAVEESNETKTKIADFVRHNDMEELAVTDKKLGDFIQR